MRKSDGFVLTRCASTSGMRARVAKNARELRLEANRLTVDHREGYAPTGVCQSCKAPWPCMGWQKAQQLLREAQRLEIDT